VTRIPYIPIEKIHRAADSFRDQYAKESCPVEIQDIVEFDLGMKLIPHPGLWEHHGIDAFLTSDFSGICIDENQLLQECYQGRLRFSLAHEIGHKILHRNLWLPLKIERPVDYLRFYDTLDEREYGSIEFQAYEFAGRMLVDPVRLKQELEKQLKKIPSEFDIKRNATAIGAYVASPIARVFGVSSVVIEKRLQKEKLIQLN
jgi:hypothetical protein